MMVEVKPGMLDRDEPSSSWSDKGDGNDNGSSFAVAKRDNAGDASSSAVAERKTDGDAKALRCGDGNKGDDEEQYTDAYFAWMRTLKADGTRDEPPPPPGRQPQHNYKAPPAAPNKYKAELTGKHVPQPKRYGP